MTQRADAVRNRLRLLATAEDMFARDGLGVSVDDIARRAGVGIGTLYRHFPTKAALVAAIVVERISRVADRAESLAGAADPGAALFELIEHMGAEGAAKRDFVQSLGERGLAEAPGAAVISQRLRKALAALIAQAQAAGAVRRDVTAADLLALLRGLLEAAGADSRARQRLLRILIDGLRLPRS